MGQNDRKWFPGDGGGMGIKGTVGIREMFHFMIVIAVYTVVYIYKTQLAQWVHFIVYKWYSNKTHFQESQGQIKKNISTYIQRFTISYLRDKANKTNNKSPVSQQIMWRTLGMQNAKKLAEKPEYWQLLILEKDADVNPMLVNIPLTRR